MQRDLLEFLKGGFVPTVYVHGYVDNRNIQSNADVHARHRWVLRVDLKDFFPSINFGRIRGLLMGEPYNFPASVATVLAKLCTHNNELPQGGPTSPLLSNLICRGLDRRLAKLAHEKRCRYSRYCDDLVFSTDVRGFPVGLAHIDRVNGEVSVGGELVRVIEEEGFQVNPAKTTLRSRAERQMVTGLVVNQFTNIPRKYIRHLQNLLYIWRKYGEGEAEARFRLEDHRYRPARVAKFRSAVRGQVQYVGSVKGWGHPVYVRLSAELTQLDSAFRPTVIAATAAPFGTTLLSGQLFFEGKTDYTHLTAALRHFQGEGRFLELDLKFPATEISGDGPLKAHAKALSVTKQPITCLVIFDRDKPGFVKDIESEDGSPKDWSNKVISFALPYPSHRPAGSRICIESLYTDSDLQRLTPEGWRVYLRDEFDKDGIHKVDGTLCVNAHHDTLVPEKVRSPKPADGEKNLALSKRAFADAVANGTPPHEQISFDGFVPLFEQIERVLRDQARSGSD